MYINLRSLCPYILWFSVVERSFLLVIVGDVFVFGVAVLVSAVAFLIVSLSSLFIGMYLLQLSAL